MPIWALSVLSARGSTYLSAAAASAGSVGRHHKYSQGESREDQSREVYDCRPNGQSPATNQSIKFERAKTDPLAVARDSGDPKEPSEQGRPEEAVVEHREGRRPLRRVIHPELEEQCEGQQGDDTRGRE